MCNSNRQLFVCRADDCSCVLMIEKGEERRWSCHSIALRLRAYSLRSALMSWTTQLTAPYRDDTRALDLVSDGKLECLCSHTLLF